MFEGQITEKSLTGSSWWSVAKKVYRESFAGTFVVACMIEFHKAVGTWHKKVNKYISLTQFAKQKYIQAGWPDERLIIKPNFIEDPIEEATQLDDKVGGYGIYVGRLSAEKGIDILLKSWNEINYPLKVVGNGPQEDLLHTCDNKKVDYLGLRQKNEVLELVKKADFLVMASTWYEGFPMVLVEAFACGTCAVVPNLGGMAEIVEDGVTGLHFEAGNAEDLSRKISWLLDHPDKMREMGRNARATYLQKYTPAENYKVLMSIYEAAQKDR